MGFYQMGDLQSTVTGYEPVLGDNGLQRTYGVAKTHNDRSQSSLESGLGGGSPSPEEIILSGVLIPLMGDLKGSEGAFVVGWSPVVNFVEKCDITRDAVIFGESRESKRGMYTYL